MNTIALMGNPNSGKTTLFNALTGSNQHVGNWPGVTVEKKEGSYNYNDIEYNIVDLPGTYSLGAYSEDEVVARDFILTENPDVVVNVVDATNLERNLFLTTQLLEMDVKVIIALNMMDEAEKRGLKIDIDRLSQELDLPVIPIIAAKEKGIEELKEVIVKTIKSDKIPKRQEVFNEDIKAHLKEYEELFKDIETEYPIDWLTIKLLEGDNLVLKMVEEKGDLSEKEWMNLQEDISQHELEMVDIRYGFIKKITNKVLKRPKQEVETFTDKLDKIVTNKYLGIPIFALIMFTVFQLTFFIGEDILGESIEGFVEFLGEKVSLLLVSINAPTWLQSLIGEGLFEGVGAVVEFIPIIMILYFLMGILEDTGYMARAAYVMDGVMRKIGLQGKSFIPMIVGFGCNVPGIMSTRTLDNEKDRLIAILINPFMSCGAKIPIYTIFTAAFFPDKGGIVLFTLYALGIILALIFGKIFSKVLFNDEESHFIMELPPYRAPIFKYVIRDMWEKVAGFIKRAGTVIFGVVIILWLLAHGPVGVEPYSQESYLGQIGTFVAPIFSLSGFGNWQASVSLFAGIAAKEVVVATLGMVYAGVSEGTQLVNAIQGAFTPLSAVSFMVMTLLYTPCAAVLGTVKQETNSVKWAVFLAVYTFLVGLIASIIVYQGGLLLGFS